MITPMGEYQPEGRAVEGALEINPVMFVSTNWLPLCTLVGLSPVPKLRVIMGMPACPDQDTSAIYVLPNEEVVCVDVTDLNIDCVRMSEMPGLCTIGMLWGMMSVAARVMLFRRGMIPDDQRLDLESVTRHHWPAAIITLAQRNQLFHVQSESAQKAADAQLIQVGVQYFVQSCQLNTRIDKWLKRIILAHRENLPDYLL